MNSISISPNLAAAEGGGGGQYLTPVVEAVPGSADGLWWDIVLL
jgi:hypothetical protein